MGTFTADDSGSVRIGWVEDLALTVPTFNDPTGPNGVRWQSGGLAVAFECSMGRAEADLSAGIPLLDDELVTLELITSPSVCGDAVVSATEVCDDGVNDGTGPLGCLPGCVGP